MLDKEGPYPYLISILGGCRLILPTYSQDLTSQSLQAQFIFEPKKITYSRRTLYDMLTGRMSPGLSMSNTPPPHTAYMIDVPVQIQVRLLYYSSGRSDSAKAHRSNGFRSIGTSDRFHNWCLIYFANIRKRFFSIHAKQKYAREATVIKACAHTRLFSNWDLKFCFS